ncbi:hypothetical protein EV1_044129 [Malus domestica]
MRLVSYSGISPNIMLLERSKLVIKPSTVLYFDSLALVPKNAFSMLLASPSLEKVVTMDVKFWKHLGIIFKVQNLENCETTEFIRNGTMEIICTKAKNYQMWKAWANPNWNASNPDFLYLTWPQDPVEFNSILGRYKASKDAAAPGFLKRSFSLSDFYEAKMKKDADSDDGDYSDGGDGGDDGDGDDDDHVDPKLKKSEDELIKLIASLEAKIQASTLGIDSMERYYANPMNTTSTTSTSAMELKPPLPVKCPMLPSAQILNLELQKKI